MVSAAAMRSAIVLSITGKTTRAVVTDRVDGEPRLVATLSRVGRSVSGVLERLEQTLGRRAYDRGRLIDARGVVGDGADGWFVVGFPSSVPTLALVVLGNEGDIGDLAMAAVRSTPIRLVRSVFDETTSPTAFAHELSQHEPDLLMLAGVGSEPLWRSLLAALSCAISDRWRPRLGIVVAPEPVQQVVAAALGEQMDLIGVDPAGHAPADVVRALSTELRARAAERLREELGDDVATDPVDRLTALERAAAFLVRRTDQRLVMVDLEQGTTVLWARPEGMATVYRADRDFGQDALGLAALVGAPVARWLPWSSSEDESLDWLANRALCPHPAMLGARDRLLAAAFVRASIHDLLTDLERPIVQDDITLVALGPWFATLSPSLAVLCALDGFEPVPANGLVSIALDEADLLAAGGAIAGRSPGYAASVLERDALLPLAHVIVLAGDGIEGAVAVRGELRIGEVVQRFSVPWGSIHVLPCAPGTLAELSLEPEAGVRIGKLEPGVALQFAGDAALGWAQIGIVIDARGRPLRLASEPTARIRQVRSWLEDLGIPWGGSA
ncbi:MAG: hypothetical protein RMH81_01920 [Thermomicrobium sp.]|nr:hypothetical protein [Thermomicrobium sp.]